MEREHTYAIDEMIYSCKNATAFVQDEKYDITEILKGLMSVALSTTSINVIKVS